MRRVFVIGDLPTWTTGAAVESAVTAFLDARDSTGFARVFIKGNRVNVSQIPDNVAADLRAWYEEGLRRGRLTPS